MQLNGKVVPWYVKCPGFEPITEGRQIGDLGIVEQADNLSTQGAEPIESQVGTSMGYKALSTYTYIYTAV